MSERRRWVAHSRDATLALAEALGRHARPGLILGLTGALGAGKTTFVQGLARGLAVPVDVPVTSPSYTLVQHYAGRLPLVHIDAYRLQGPQDLRGIDADDWLDAEGVVAIEWADRIASGLPHDMLWCTFEHRTLEERAIELQWVGLRATEVLASLPSAERIHPKLELLS